MADSWCRKPRPLSSHWSTMTWMIRNLNVVDSKHLFIELPFTERQTLVQTDVKLQLYETDVRAD